MTFDSTAVHGHPLCAPSPFLHVSRNCGDLNEGVPDGFAGATFLFACPAILNAYLAVADRAVYNTVLPA